jgi:hypothetical protein
MNNRLPARGVPVNSHARWAALGPELAWMSAAIEDAGAWSELLTCWLWEIAAESTHDRN